MHFLRVGVDFSVRRRFLVHFGLSLAADRLRNIAEDVKAFTLEIVFDVTQRAQRGTSQGTAVVKCVGGSSRSHP